MDAGMNGGQKGTKYDRSDDTDQVCHMVPRDNALGVGVHRVGPLFPVLLMNAIFRIDRGSNPSHPLHINED
jgi:hypothetical protein